MNFAHPHMLWLLLVIPPGLAFFFWRTWRTRQRLMTQFIEARLLPGLLFGLSPARQRIRFACLVGSVACIILALARPQWGFTVEQVMQKGLDIVVAIDTSKSMLAEDIPPNRLARAKLAALDLMKIAKSDRLGLVAFAGGAFLQCPLTIDDNAFRQSVEALDVNIIPQGGTALAEAITTAATAYKEGDNFKILVLFTDGEDNDEGAIPAAEAAAREGLKIFTVGIGTPDGEILRLKDAKGRTDYIRNSDGQVVKSRLNEKLLKDVAEATGGYYFPLRGAKTMDALYERGLAPLPKSEGQERLLRRYIERYHWPLSAAIMLLLIEMILPERRALRRKTTGETGDSGPVAPAEPEASAVAGVARVLVICLVLGWSSVAGASPGTALKNYEEGKFDAAQKEYERLAQKKQDDLRLHFNAGAAAYRDGKLDEAIKHFGDAVPAQDLALQEQAYYNLGNTLYRAGAGIPDPKKKQESWESALKQYDNVIKLNTNNADAKFNQEFVKRRLEELKQQQQQQQKQDNKDNKDDKDKKDDQNKQDQQKDQKDQKQDQQKDQQKQDDKKDQQQAKNDEQKKDEQKDQKDQSGKKDQNQKPDEQKGNSSDDKSKEKDDKEEQGQPRPVSARAMTPQEAKQLLDAQKGNERVLQFRPEGEPKRANRQLKDW